MRKLGVADVSCSGVSQTLNFCSLHVQPKKVGKAHFPFLICGRENHFSINGVAERRRKSYLAIITNRNRCRAKKPVVSAGTMEFSSLVGLWSERKENYNELFCENRWKVKKPYLYRHSRLLPIWRATNMSDKRYPT